MLKQVVVGLLAGVSATAWGQSLEPRFYSNAPAGMNFLVGGAAYSRGGLSVDPALSWDDAQLDIYAPFAGYARSLALFGRSAKFDLAVPYVFLEGSALVDGSREYRSVDGFADPQVRFSYNFFGAPALPLEEFRAYRQNWILGGSLKMTLPLGQYDAERLVNIGTHRWSFTPELGVSKQIGGLRLEAAGAVTFYTDNTDFNGGNRRSQEPIYSIQANIVYVFRNQVWMAVGGTRYTGGRTSVNGVRNSDLIQNSRAGCTLAVPVAKKHSLKLYASTGIALRIGSDFDTFGAAWQYRWGGGL